jgi:hypothetical protein
MLVIGLMARTFGRAARQRYGSAVGAKPRK